MTRNCIESASSPTRCEFTIQFDPPLKGVRGVTVKVPYLEGNEAFRAKDVELVWDANAIIKALVPQIEGAFESRIVQSVSDYTRKYILEQESAPGSNPASHPSATRAN